MIQGVYYILHVIYLKTLNKQMAILLENNQMKKIFTNKFRFCIFVTYMKVMKSKASYIVKRTRNKK